MKYNKLNSSHVPIMHTAIAKINTYQVNLIWINKKRLTVQWGDDEAPGTLLFPSFRPSSSICEACLIRHIRHFKIKAVCV